MSTSQTALHRHLEIFIEDLMQQKFRLDISKEDYQKLLDKIRERIVDETTLINTSDGDRKENFIKRRNADSKHLSNIIDILDKQADVIESMVEEIQHHLTEFSDIELERSGFITHIVTVDENSKFNKNTKVITFNKEGHAEIPIATNATRWADASQVRIIPTTSK